MAETVTLIEAPKVNLLWSTLPL